MNFTLDGILYFQGLSKKMYLNKHVTVCVHLISAKSRIIGCANLSHVLNGMFFKRACTPELKVSHSRQHKSKLPLLHLIKSPSAVTVRPIHPPPKRLNRGFLHIQCGNQSAVKKRSYPTCFVSKHRPLLNDDNTISIECLPPLQTRLSDSP